MHCSSLLFDITQRVSFPFEMFSAIGDKGYISAFSISITVPDWAEYVNNAPIILRLAFSGNVLLFFLAETDLLVSLNLTNRQVYMILEQGRLIYQTLFSKSPVLLLPLSCTSRINSATVSSTGPR